MQSLLRVENQERVDLGDFQFLAQDTAIGLGTSLPSNLLANPSGQRAWIVSGFDLSEPAAGQVRSTRGVAMLSFVEKGSLKHGAITAQGDAHKTVDVSGYADGTYGCYVRFAYVDGETQNRVFWNPGANQEGTESIATRRTATWDFSVASAAPGSEWLKIGEAAVAGGSVSSITDQRPLYFEGTVSASYARSWGGGTDRNANRATNGLKDLRSALDALFKKVEEIQTGTNPNITGQRWWTAPTYSLDDMLPLAGATGDRAMRGNIFFDADDVRELGENLVRPAQVYVKRIHVDTVVNLEGTAVLFIPGTGTVNLDGDLDQDAAAIGVWNGDNDFRGLLDISNGGSIHMGPTGSGGTWQSAGNLDWSGTGRLNMSGAGSGITMSNDADIVCDELVPSVSAGSFIGAAGNPYAEGFFIDLDVADDLTVDGDILPGNAGVTRLGLDGTTRFGSAHAETVVGYTAIRSDSYQSETGDPFVRRIECLGYMAGYLDQSVGSAWSGGDTSAPPSATITDSLFVVPVGQNATLKRVQVTGDGADGNDKDVRVRLQNRDGSTVYLSATPTVGAAAPYDSGTITQAVDDHELFVRVESVVDTLGNAFRIWSVLLDVEYTDLQDMLGIL